MRFAYAGNASTNASGAYAVTGLPTGAYYLVVWAEDYIGEIYNEIPCPGYCSERAVVGAGGAIAVSVGGTVAGIDVQLDTGGRISGTVRNAATSAPIAGLYVYAARNNGSGQPGGGNGAYTSVTGAYTISGLAGGEYVLADVESRRLAESDVSGFELRLRVS